MTTITNETPDTHQCLSHREGNWIIFHCPLCKDYERRVNWKTREVKVRRGSSNAVHAGSHAPVEVQAENFSNNRQMQYETREITWVDAYLEKPPLWRDNFSKPVLLYDFESDVCIVGWFDKD